MEERSQREIGAEVAAGIHTEAYSRHAAVTRFVAYRIKSYSLRCISYVDLEHSFGHAYVDIVALLIEFDAEIKVIKTVCDVGRKLDVRDLRQYHRIAQ